MRRERAAEQMNRNAQCYINVPCWSDWDTAASGNQCLFSQKAAGRSAPPTQQGLQSVEDMTTLTSSAAFTKRFLNKLNNCACG